ncbi:MAG: hypothetical protein G01um101424_248 [Parcubacteria group bacterium Gr01-1014_24]|nr:MAG: hypothetical protein G01um101424_248 [Parcubacteria group bacterium Gr01-1014_24]
MKTRMEKSPGLMPKQFDLEFRSREELVQSIRKKMAKGLPLDPTEASLVAEEREQDLKDRTSPYRDPNH